MTVSLDEWHPKGVSTLEPRAWEAIREVDRHVCVTASAGAGKTEFLAQKAAYLFETGLCPSPRRILAISFKRDAARNLSDRLKERCRPDHARRLQSMTFDAFTKRLVDQFRLAIPSPHRPSLNYTIGFETDDQLGAFLRACPRIELSDRADDDSKTVFKARMEAPCGTRPPGGSIVATSPDMKPT